MTKKILYRLLLFVPFIGLIVSIHKLERKFLYNITYLCYQMFSSIMLLGWFAHFFI